MKSEPADALGNKDNLALLYQGLLTGIVRMQVGRQPVLNADSLRKRTKTALDEVEREAIARGYDRRDVHDTHFAVVAFLDSVVLNKVDPIRAEWERQTLQQELFGQADAGIVFFEKLDLFLDRQDSTQLADILEVYLLCLLLGFEGRYSGAAHSSLYTLAERVRMRIDNTRGRSNSVSPTGLSSLKEGRMAPQLILERPLFWWAAPVAAASTVLLYLILRFKLSSAIDQITSSFQ